MAFRDLSALRRCVAVLLAVVAGALFCGFTVPAPEGAAPMRYRDQVFSTVTKTSDLRYGAAPDAQGNSEDLMLDLYQPSGDAQTARPALVWVHGGGFSAGDKTNGVPVDVANALAAKGYLVVSINYRLLADDRCYSDPTLPVCTTAANEAKHDAQAAVRWLRANASTHRVDPDRIAVGGESAGGITATLVGLNAEEPGASGNPGYSSAVRGFVSVSGGVPGGALADSATDAPGLLFHGTADSIVSPSWSVDTAEKLRQAGVYTSLQLQDGAGHVPWVSYRSLYLDQTTNFLYQALIRGITGPTLKPPAVPSPSTPTAAAVPSALQPRDTTRPRFGSLRVSRKTFRAGRRGTRVRFRVSEPGTVRFSIQRRTRGRHGRWATVRGGIRVATRRGGNAFTFKGRVGRRKLAPGTYRLAGRATDRARNRSSVQRARFRIVR